MTYDEVAYGIGAHHLRYIVDEAIKPLDFEQAEPSYRMKIKGCDSENLFEMQLDAAELEFVQRFAKLSLGASEYSCMPIIEVTLRVRSGDLDDERNFRSL